MAPRREWLWSQFCWHALRYRETNSDWHWSQMEYYRTQYDQVTGEERISKVLWRPGARNSARPELPDLRLDYSHSTGTRTKGTKNGY